MNDLILTESILDPIQASKCKEIWEIPEGKDPEEPKMKDDVRSFILSMAENWRAALGNKFNITSVSILGSSTSRRYNETSDIDINLFLDCPREVLKGKFSTIPKGVILPNTQHPINCTIFCTDDARPFDINNAQNLYDIINNKWVKTSPELTTEQPIPYSYLYGIADVIIKGIISVITDYQTSKNLLSRISHIVPGKDDITEQEKDEKLKEILMNIRNELDALKYAHHLLFVDEQNSFAGADSMPLMIAYKAGKQWLSVNTLLYKTIDSYKIYGNGEGLLDTINQIQKEGRQIIKDTQKLINKTLGNSPEISQKIDTQKDISNDTHNSLADNPSDYQTGIENNLKESAENEDIICKKLKFLIDDESEAVQGYDKSILEINMDSSIPEDTRKNIEKCLTHIRDEEHEHIRELQELMKNPNNSIDLEENYDIIEDLLELKEERDFLVFHNIPCTEENIEKYRILSESMILEEESDDNTKESEKDNKEDEKDLPKRMTYKERERLMNRTENSIDRSASWKSGKTKKYILPTAIGAVIAGPLGALGGALVGKERADDAEADASDFKAQVMDDPACAELLDKIRNEINSERPDKAKIKQYKKELKQAMNIVKNRRKVERRENTQYARIRLREDKIPDEIIGQILVDNGYENSWENIKKIRSGEYGIFKK